jgi:predicted SAM-dependent methyltransferase
VVGASGDSFSGWITTEKYFFDITDRRSTSALIGGAKVRSFLLEHVLEHLSYEDATEAIKNLVRCVAAGGTIRIAVPDGNHPDENYRTLVGVDGPDDHLHLWTLADAVDLARQSKCAIEMVEHFTEGGQFVSTHLSDSETIARDRGLVARSVKNSGSRADSKDYGPFGYTSLIFDLVADPPATSGTATDL